MEMLEGVAAYLTLAPLVATVALGALLVAFWLDGRRPAPVRIRIRHRR